MISGDSLQLKKLKKQTGAKPLIIRSNRKKNKKTKKR